MIYDELINVAKLNSLAASVNGDNTKTCLTEMEWRDETISGGKKEIEWKMRQKLKHLKEFRHSKHTEKLILFKQLNFVL